MKYSYEELDKLLCHQIVDLLTEKLKPYIIYVFGSYTRGELMEDSDIDIAFYAPVDISSYEVFMLAQDIADILSCDVDLVDLSKASIPFKAQVAGKGRVLYFSDEKVKTEFEMRALKDYAILNEDRAVVLEAIKKRGSVYGS